MQGTGCFGRGKAKGPSGGLIFKWYDSKWTWTSWRRRYKEARNLRTFLKPQKSQKSQEVEKAVSDEWSWMLVSAFVGYFQANVLLWEDLCGSWGIENQKVSLTGILSMAVWLVELYLRYYNRVFLVTLLFFSLPFCRVVRFVRNDLFIDMHEKESLYIFNRTSFLMTGIRLFRSQFLAQFPQLELNWQITMTNNNDK